MTEFAADKFSWRIEQGDCRKVLPTLEADSVDTVITDPPYGLEFMGKEWDKLTRNLMNPDSEADKERKAEYGGSYSGRLSNLPDLSSSGLHREQIAWHCEWAKAALRVAKPGAMLLCFGGTRTWHRIACAIEDAGWEIRDTICWLYGSGFPKSLDISKAIDKAAGAEREVVGKSNRHGGGIVGAGSSYELPPDIPDITAPATAAAQEWDGYGTGLKPAFEPIIVAMKPLEKGSTFAANALKHGVAGLWIEGGRIPKQDGDRTEYGVNGIERKTGNVYGEQSGQIEFDGTQGRWPANVILGDEETAAQLDEQSGERPSSPFKSASTKGHRNILGDGPSADYTGDGYTDSGGASRFFYCAKASRAEREAGLEGLEPQQRDESRKEGNPGGDNPRNRGVKQVLNSHPTVKPVELMRYLCRLTKTPTAGVVLDPFMGSGSTGVGCVQEGRSFIGIELDEGYYKIAQARIAEAQRQHQGRLIGAD